jgi:hypothetical protein
MTVVMAYALSLNNYLKLGGKKPNPELLQMISKLNVRTPLSNEEYKRLLQLGQEINPDLKINE